MSSPHWHHEHVPSDDGPNRWEMNIFIPPRGPEYMNSNKWCTLLHQIRAFIFGDTTKVYPNSTPLVLSAREPILKSMGFVTPIFYGFVCIFSIFFLYMCDYFFLLVSYYFSILGKLSFYVPAQITNSHA